MDPTIKKNLLQLKIFKKKEYHNYKEIFKILNFYLSKSHLLKG